MQKKNSNFFVFFLFLLLCVFFIFFAKTRLGSSTESLLEVIVSPLHSISNSLFTQVPKLVRGNDTIQLEDENRTLVGKLSNQQKIMEENKQLKSQLQKNKDVSYSLIVANVVGAPGFIPGLSYPSILIIDKGASSGIKSGYPVILQGNVVGKIDKVSPHHSLVLLLTNQKLSTTAKTLTTGALGVLKGEGNGEFILDNVLMSQSLKIGDIVLTKGDIDISGIGFPPDLVLGKVLSVDKKPSALFQSASVQSLLDFSHLSTVFIITP